MAIKKEASREEDYRDYEERDLQDGWPYGDKEGGNKSFTVARTDFDGQQERQPDSITSHTRGLEVSDDIEERVMDALSAVEGVSPEMIDVRSEGTVVILEGEVDDATTARSLVKVAQRVAGVTGVRNHLTVIGVDANIPDDE